MSMPVLVIGNKNYSSWSLRPWLLLTQFEIPFKIHQLMLCTPSFDQDITTYDAAGKVPVLQDGDTLVWDSLAICEYVSERWLAGAGWPSEIAQRAKARSISAEMHSGFFALRELMPMNCRRRGTLAITADVQADIDRIQGIWQQCRAQNQSRGPWLFGDFSIADAMYAPIVSRFHSYGVILDGLADEYATMVKASAAYQSWITAALQEHDVIDEMEVEA